MNKKAPQLNQHQNTPQLSQLAINKFLDNQAKELELKSQELVIRKAEIDHNQDYALKSLAAQKEDRQETRNTYKTIMKTKIIVYCVCFVAVLIFSAYALFIGESQILKEIMTIVAPAIATGIGGFYYGKHKGIDSERNSD